MQIHTKTSLAILSILATSTQVSAIPTGEASSIARRQEGGDQPVPYPDCNTDGDAVTGNTLTYLQSYYQTHWTLPDAITSDGAGNTCIAAHTVCCSGACLSVINNMEISQTLSVSASWFNDKFNLIRGCASGKGSATSESDTPGLTASVFTCNNNICMYNSPGAVAGQNDVGRPGNYCPDSSQYACPGQL